jgi:hypothetical protein
VLVAVDGFVASTAIAGGVALVVGAERLRFPPGLLADTPFRNYVIPGLILASVVGGSAAAATAAMLCRPRIGWWASVLAGGVLMGWILGEIVILPPSERSWIEVYYFILGLTMACLGLTLRKAMRATTPSGEVISVRGQSGLRSEGRF